MYSLFTNLTSRSWRGKSENELKFFPSRYENKTSYSNLLNSLGGLPKSILIAAFPVVYAEGIDSISNEMTEQQKLKAKIIERMRMETKGERLRRMFALNEFGDLSPEMKYIATSAYTTFIIGAMAGALFKGTQTKDDYLRRNKHKQYESAHLARRNFVDTISMAAFRNGFTYGGKLCISSSFYLLTTMAIANYNNKVTVFEHIFAGALFGSLARVNYGLRGMLVASGLGGFLGLCAGSIFLGVLKVSNLSFEELRYWRHEFFHPEMQITSKAED